MMSFVTNLLKAWVTSIVRLPVVIVLTFFDGFIVGLENSFYFYVSDFFGFDSLFSFVIFLFAYIFAVSAILERAFRFFGDLFQRTER